MPFIPQFWFRCPSCGTESGPRAAICRPVKWFCFNCTREFTVAELERTCTAGCRWMSAPDDPARMHECLYRVGEIDTNARKPIDRNNPFVDCPTWQAAVVVQDMINPQPQRAIKPITGLVDEPSQ